LRGGSGLGKPLKLITRPLREHIPIYLGAEGPKNIAMATELCDGWLPLYYSPYRPEVYADALVGAKPGFEIASPVTVNVNDDLAAPGQVHAGLLHRRHGRPEAELPRQPGPPHGLRRRRRSHPGPLPRRPAGRGGRGGARRVRRRDLAGGTEGAYPGAPPGLEGGGGHRPC